MSPENIDKKNQVILEIELSSINKQKSFAKRIEINNSINVRGQVQTFQCPFIKTLFYYC